MPQAANLTIYDGESSPVARVFSPAEIGPVNAVFENVASGVVAGFDRLVVTTRRSSIKNQNHKVRVSLVCPVLEVTSPSTSTGIQPAPTIAYSVSSVFEQVSPARSTKQNRKNNRVLMSNFLINPFAVPLIDDCQSVW